MGYIIKGENNCYYCNNCIRWGKTIIDPGIIDLYEINGQEADVVLTGREDGKMNYEATVRCNKCSSINKFIGKINL